MKEKIELVTIKAINIEDTNIDVDYFKKYYKSALPITKGVTCNLLVGINAKGWSNTSVCLTELEEVIADSEWRLANEYNEYPDATWNKAAFTKDKNETAREKKLLAALKEVHALGADVKIKF